MATVKAIFLLPERDSDRRSLAAEIEEARSQIWDLFHALTNEGQVLGDYRMADGTRAEDSSKRYSLILEESRLSELEEILLAFKRKTTQEAIYLEIQHGIELRLL
jgi:hypothetical protein